MKPVVTQPMHMASFIMNINLLSSSLVWLFVTTTLLLVSYIFISSKTSRKVFLLDFACYKPPNTLICTRKMIIERIMKFNGDYTEETVSFMNNVMRKAGIGDSTYVSEGFLSIPQNLSTEGSRQEGKMVMFGAIDNLLAKSSTSNVEIKDIGILIVNCSLFNVVPSLTSIIVNRYKLRHNIATYNLTGMGCGASLTAVNLAKQLLQVHHNQYALIVSTENITQNMYKGKERAKLLGNCLFRLGGAAILLSNRSSDSKLSKYQLMHSVHNNFASCDISYNCISQEEDEEGLLGVTISQDLFTVAENAIKTNLRLLGPLILPLSEKIKYIENLLTRKLRMGKVKQYTPKFEKCVNHFFPHTGGKKLLDDLQKRLGLSDKIIEPARTTLYKYGNTSSSTIWYSLAYAEAKGRIKKGDLSWQIAFGAGFYCTSVVWCAMRDVPSCEEMNPWNEEIDEYPLILDI